jgi:hypothetical protein
MATMTMEPATLKTAMSKIGLEEEKADELLDMLDKMELDRELEISLAQADRGEKIPIEEAERIMRERFANGYYDKK